MIKFSLVVIQLLVFLILLSINEVPILGASDVTYTKDVKPIFKSRCAVCHNENMPDKNWMIYDQAFKNKDKIKIRVANGTMPPGNSTAITKQEIQTIIDWVDGGGKK